MEFYDQNANNYGMWPASDVTNIDLQVLQANPTANYSYPDLTIQSSTATVRADGTYWVTGTMKNTGSQTARYITVVGTYYNSQGTVVATGFSNATLTASLAPSATAEFALGAFDLNQTTIPTAQKIATYSLLIQPVGPILVGNAPVVTPYHTTTSTSQASSGATGFPPSSQQPTNTTDNTTITYAIASVIILAVIAAAIVMMKKRKSPAQKSNEPQRTQPKSKSKRERKQH